MSRAAVAFCVTLLAVLCSCHAAAASSNLDSDKWAANRTTSLFHRWAKKYSMKFDAKEKKHRLKVFAKNLRRIRSINKRQKSYTAKLNQFAHLSFAEFKKLYLGHRPSSARNANASRLFQPDDVTAAELNRQVPASVDWRTHGAVSPVKDRGACGSDWAFAAAAAAESAHKIKGGKLAIFSPQQAVSCDSHSSGCSGGTASSAFQYWKNNGGIALLRDYPYTSDTGQNGSCNAKASHSRVPVKGIGKVPDSNEKALQARVAQQPVAVAFKVHGNFMFYAGGIYQGPCGTQQNHAVVAVGYGTSPSGVPYWILKNSWGPEFGENGFFRFARNYKKASGLCGIAVNAVYPIL